MCRLGRISGTSCLIPLLFSQMEGRRLSKSRVCWSAEVSEISFCLLFEVPEELSGGRSGMLRSGFRVGAYGNIRSDLSDGI